MNRFPDEQSVLVLIGADDWGRKEIIGFAPARRIALQSPAGQCMAFKLMMSAQTKWRKHDGANRMHEIIERIASKDGIKQLNQAA